MHQKGWWVGYKRPIEVAFLHSGIGFGSLHFATGGRWGRGRDTFFDMKELFGWNSLSVSVRYN
jgi:hypothetical protein